MKTLIAVSIITAGLMFPANAEEKTLPNLKGYVCVDPKGRHYSWKAAFDGVTFCKLIPNKFSKK